VAIYDQQLRSHFEWLRDPNHEEVATPPLLMVFDLIYRGGRDQTKRPLRERRARLEESVAGAERVFPVPRLASSGLMASGEVLKGGFEGYVAKDEASPYVGHAGPPRTPSPPRPSPHRMRARASAAVGRGGEAIDVSA
jgi:ATP-dependent DNA ligase